MLKQTQFKAKGTSTKGAKDYFTKSLAGNDYYVKKTERVEVLGQWGGALGREQLGLVGEVKKEDFFALVDNKQPNSGENLTARTKSDRTLFYDFTFNAPKSVSILHEYANTKEKMIIQGAFENAVDLTLQKIEQSMEARIRKGKDNQHDETRTTGNMVYARFTHFDSRPVKGVSDCHLHTHACILNATWDAEEKKIKAGQFREIIRKMPEFQDSFHNTLKQNLVEIGYDIEETGKAWNQWKVRGIGDDTIVKFSQRTQVITEKADKIEARIRSQKPDIGEQYIATMRGNVGAKTRDYKINGYTDDARHQQFLNRMTEKEKADMEKILQSAEAKKEMDTLKLAGAENRGKTNAQQNFKPNLEYDEKQAFKEVVGDFKSQGVEVSKETEKKQTQETQKQPIQEVKSKQSDFEAFKSNLKDKDFHKQQKKENPEWVAVAKAMEKNQKVKERTDKIKETVTNVKENTVEKFKQYTDKIKDKTKEMTENAGEKIKAFADKFKGDKSLKIDQKNDKVKENKKDMNIDR